MPEPKHTISFTVDHSDYRVIEVEAASRGLTPSSLAKMRMMDSLSRTQKQSVFAEMHAIKQEYEERIADICDRYDISREIAEDGPQRER